MKIQKRFLLQLTRMQKIVKEKKFLLCMMIQRLEMVKLDFC